jgi:LPXTG-motif cell wall-anchored protein
VNGIPNRVVRLVTLVSVAAVSILGSTQAMAAAPITYYQGSANGTALAVAANPSAVLNLKMAAVNTILQTLATSAGLNLQSLIGGTLADPTQPISIVVDQAHSLGTSQNVSGQALTSGTSTTTPLSIDAASLSQELTVLKAALHNVPAGAVGQVNTLLGTLPSNPALAPLTAALTQLSGQVADTLGNPAVNAFDSVSAHLPTPAGELNPVNNGNFTAGPSFLTSGPFVLGPFAAEALAKDAQATNTLTSLDLAPTGNIGVPSASSISTLLTSVLTDLQTLETALGNTVSIVPGVGGVLGGTLSTITSTATPAVQQAIAAVNSAYATLVSSLSTAFNALGLINNLQLNDLLSTGRCVQAGLDTPCSTALTSLSRDLSTGMVTSNGLSQLAHIDVLKLTNPVLVSLLGQVNSASGGQLGDLTNASAVSLDGVKGTATATADGTTTHETANGKLVDLKVLGIDLASKTGLSLDKILPPGTVCTIQVPGTITCPGLGADPALNAINSVLGNIPAINGLLTITLTRGANVDSAGPDLTHAAASIVTLEVNAAIDCSKVPALSTIQSLAGSVPLVNLSLCSAAAAQGAAAPRQTARATSAPAGSTSLVDVQLGQADAAVTLTPCVTGDAVCPVAPLKARIPNTGNNMLILAAFGLILAAAGIAINRRRIPVRG